MSADSAYVSSGWSLPSPAVPTSQDPRRDAVRIGTQARDSTAQAALQDRRTIRPPGGASLRSATPAVSRGRDGFTLIEMLITAALILIMFVMLYGTSSKSFQRKQKLSCQKNLQVIFVALQIYANDHEDAYPQAPKAATSEAPLALLVPRYTSLTQPFICPGTKESALPEGESFANRRINYAYYMGRKKDEGGEILISDEQINTKPKIHGQPLFSADGKTAGNNHNKYGGNLLFADGHAEMTGPKAPFSILLTNGVVLLNPKPR